VAVDGRVAVSIAADVRIALRPAASSPNDRPAERPSTNEPARTPRRTLTVTFGAIRSLALIGALLVPLGLVACGSEDSSSSDATSGAPAASGAESEESEEEEEEEGHEVVPDAEVTAGLAELQTKGAAVVAAVRAGQADEAAVDAMFEKWASFEGTIKQNEVEMYLTFEDNLANLRKAVEDGDADAAGAAMSTISETASAYLAKHP
jgi:hypothetical protein